jgi:hypothetical protein
MTDQVNFLLRPQARLRRKTYYNSYAAFYTQMGRILSRKQIKHANLHITCLKFNETWQKE